MIEGRIIASQNNEQEKDNKWWVVNGEWEGTLNDYGHLTCNLTGDVVGGDFFVFPRGVSIPSDYHESFDVLTVDSFNETQSVERDEAILLKYFFSERDQEIEGNYPDFSFYIINKEFLWVIEHMLKYRY